jgi:hypothetical protein
VFAATLGPSIKLVRALRLVLPVRAGRTSAPARSWPFLHDTTAFVDPVETCFVPSYGPLNRASRLLEDERLLLDREISVAEAEHLAAFGQGQQLARSIPDFLVLGQQRPALSQSIFDPALIRYELRVSLEVIINKMHDPA